MTTTGGITPKVHTIKTKNQGTIAYTLKEGGKLRYKESQNGEIKFYGNDAKIILPDNTASNVTTGGGNSWMSRQLGTYSKNIEIIDGKEQGAGKSDKIGLYGDNISFTAARKVDEQGHPVWAKNSNHGDNILVDYGEGNQVFARSGNNVTFGAYSIGGFAEVYQGSEVNDYGSHNSIQVKSSPNMKYESDLEEENITSTVSINSNPSSDINVEDDTYTVVSGGGIVRHNYEDITKPDDDVTDDYDIQYYHK